MSNDILVPDIANDQLDIVRKVVRAFTVTVNLLDKAVEHADLIAAAQKLIANSAADKSRAAGN
jgi:hypothetical protein